MASDAALFSRLRAAECRRSRSQLRRLRSGSLRIVLGVAKELIDGVEQSVGIARRGKSPLRPVRKRSTGLRRRARAGQAGSAPERAQSFQSICGRRGRPCASPAERRAQRRLNRPPEQATRRTASLIATVGSRLKLETINVSPPAGRVQTRCCKGASPVKWYEGIGSVDERPRCRATGRWRRSSHGRAAQGCRS